MTRDELLERIERLKPWFHCVDLGDGITTKGQSNGSEPADHPAGTWKIIRNHLPDLNGKSVLDVGSNAGFYSVECKRRGARRVLAVDAQRLQVRQALLARRALGLDIECRRLSVYDLSRKSVGQFDVVLALGLLYHVKHLILAMERLFDVTGSTLIVETHVSPPDRTPPPFEHELGGLTVPLHTMMYVENPSDYSEPVYN